MPRNINLRGLKAISRRSEHIRWLWQASPDNYRMVRYHFVVVSKGNREAILESIIDQFQRFGSIVPEKEDISGRVLDSDYHYLYSCFDSPIAPREIDLSKLNVPMRWDGRLKERVRKGCSVGDYVANFYELD